MSCSKEALDDINAAGTTDVGYEIVARVAFTEEEYDVLDQALWEYGLAACSSGKINLYMKVGRLLKKVRNERK